MTKASLSHSQTVLSGRLRRGLAEVVIIAVGILLAFSVDAWWEGVRSEEDFERALSAVRAELDVNLRLLERSISAQRRVSDVGLELLALTGPDTSVEVAARAEGLLVSFMPTPQTRVQVGALNSLLESGRLDEIDSPKLPALLASLPAAFVRLNFFENEAERVMREAVFPRMWLYVPLLNAERANGLDRGEALEEFRAGVPRTSRFEADFVGLMGDLQFENAVVERASLLIIGRRDAERLGEQLRDALVLIDDRN